MGTRFYRLHDSRRDHQAILDPKNWASMGMGDGYWRDDETGQRVEDIRNGASACESIEQLAHYFAHAGVDVGRPVLVIFEGEYAPEEDHDAHLGAVLTWPSKIISVHDDDDVWNEFDEALTTALTDA